ncbi:hypothetical protein AMAG_08492 [Allomyces macrogynus ATCC 38327]|uniref:Uncharacterized protein n=1 Tax=Allomyces macrogynus (strain ATCC 38327) TaxID=578462 RepID=A0A0L0SLT7_ALLM3|nr:hypothetical protein AMAG_08492 [Allomyces macrogynus ATCC 38327]|eukprot:KNE63355.1 hypothetical protein AMAG_08492 [Allomyces macrogynus ATCC 38327]
MVELRKRAPRRPYTGDLLALVPDLLGDETDPSSSAASSSLEPPPAPPLARRGRASRAVVQETAASSSDTDHAAPMAVDDADPPPAEAAVVLRAPPRLHQARAFRAVVDVLGGLVVVAEDEVVVVDAPAEPVPPSPIEPAPPQSEPATPQAANGTPAADRAVSPTFAAPAVPIQWPPAPVPALPAPALPPPPFDPTVGVELPVGDHNEAGAPAPVSFDPESFDFSAPVNPETIPVLPVHLAARDRLVHLIAERLYELHDQAPLTGVAPRLRDRGATPGSVRRPKPGTPLAGPDGEPVVTEKRRGRPKKTRTDDGTDTRTRAATPVPPETPAREATPPPPPPDAATPVPVQALPARTTALVVRTRDDGKYTCPAHVCRPMAPNRSAFVSHIRYAEHAIDVVLAAIYPRGTDPRSDLCGTLPDSHPLTKVRADFVELLLHIPLPLYPVHVPLVVQLPGVNIDYSFPMVLGPPAWDLYAYPQLKRIITDPERPGLHHVTSLIAASVQAKAAAVVAMTQAPSRGPTPVTASSTPRTTARSTPAPDTPAPSASGWSMADVAVLEAKARKSAAAPRRKSRSASSTQEEAFGRNTLVMAHSLAGPVVEQALETNVYDVDEATWALWDRVMPANPWEMYAEIVDPAAAMAQWPEVAPVRVELNQETETAVDATLQRFESMSFDTSRRGFVLNTGGSVWGLDWMGEYLAVSGYLTPAEHHTVGDRVEGPGTIQIWHIPTITADDDAGTPAATLALCIVHEWGPCFDLHWWPVSVNEPADSPRLGLLGACFGDGKFRVLAVPRPHARDDAAMDVDGASATTAYLAPHAVFFEHAVDGTTCFKFTWGGAARVAIGCADGSLSVLDWPSVAARTCTAPAVHIPAHDAFVRDLAFEGGSNPLDPYQLVTCGADGRMLAWDLRDLGVACQLHRARAFLMSVAWPAPFDHVLYADSDHAVRVFRPGNATAPAHAAVTHAATIWSVRASVWHPFLASASADGTVQITNGNRVATGAARAVKSMPCVTLTVVDVRKSEDEVIQMADRTQFHDHRGGAAAVAAGAGTGRTKLDAPVIKFDDEVALQVVAWSNVRESCGWLASGGSAGLVRVENVAVERAE